MTARSMHWNSAPYLSPAPQRIKTSIEKGMAQGMAEEKERALQEKIGMAKAMLADGMAMELVCKYTNLSPEQIA